MSFKHFFYSADQNGYIFIDVLVAIFIFALGFAGLYALTSEGFANYLAAKQLSEAAYLAQAKLALTENALKQGQLFETIIEPGKEISGTEAGMAWTLKSQRTGVPHLLLLRVEVTWQENNLPQTFVSECLVYVNH